MDHNELSLEFDRIEALPLWQRPLELATLAKSCKVPKTTFIKSFGIYSRSRKKSL
jgi:hypothetical protein